MTIFQFRTVAFAVLLGSAYGVSVLYAQDSSDSADTEKLDQAIDEVAESNDSDVVQVGEASYNVEECRALLNEEGTQVSTGSTKSAEKEETVQQLDLDKCRALVK